MAFSFFVHQTLLSIINFFVAQPSVQFSYGSLKNYIEEFFILLYKHFVLRKLIVHSKICVCIVSWELRLKHGWYTDNYSSHSTTERTEFFFSFFLCVCVCVCVRACVRVSVWVVEKSCMERCIPATIHKTAEYEEQFFSGSFNLIWTRNTLHMEITVSFCN